LYRRKSDKNVTMKILTSHNCSSSSFGITVFFFGEDLFLGEALFFGEKTLTDDLGKFCDGIEVGLRRERNLLEPIN